MKSRRIRMVIWAAVVVVCLMAFDVRLVVRRYSVQADGLTAPVRIALVTDLHSCSYGDGQSRLIEAVHEQSPDIVLLGGDIFDDKLPDENAEVFILAMTEVYPCYYVTGNHEFWAGAEALEVQMEMLDEHGVRRLSGECEAVEINGQRVNICGVDDPVIDGSSGAGTFAGQLEAAGTADRGGAFTLLLAHRPEMIGEYAAYGFDMVLCGHAHGGQWRVPGLVNGIFAPNQGLFPEYAGGMYEYGDATLIVSRGLARESTRVPRIFNRPELVVVDIVPE